MMPQAAKLNEFITSTGNGTVDAVLLFLVSVVLIIGGGIYLYTVKLKPWFAALKVDTAVIREHTENNHAGAPNPNLRDDLDAKHCELTGQLARIALTLEDLDHSQKRVDSELQRVHGELGSMRSDISVERGRINRLLER